DVPMSSQWTQSRNGTLVVEVLDVSSRNPVPGVRVELLQTGQIQRTDANGRAAFSVPAGEYDVRVFDLSGPGPAQRTEDAHATVRNWRSVVVQVFDCQLCV